MFGSALLDVAIGLVFVYLLLAVFCTAITEVFSRRKDWRAVMLKEGIEHIFTGIPDVAQAIYAHPFIKALARKEEKPNHIPPRTFALALMDIAGRGQKGDTPHERFRAAMAGAGASAAGSDLRSMLFAVAGDPKLDAEVATERVAAWFDESMSLVTGWYRQKMQKISVVVALVVTLVANADTFHIAGRLWSNPTLRAAILAQATERAKKAPQLTIEYPDPDAPIPSAPVEAAPAASTAPSGLTQEDLAALGQVTGWSDDLHKLNAEFRRADLRKDANVLPCLTALESARRPCQPPPKPGEKVLDPNTDPCCVWVANQLAAARQDSAIHWTAMATHPAEFGAWLLWLISHRAAGWLLTAIAVSLGAPFWFAALQKLIKLRSPSESKGDKASGRTPPATAPAKG
ncbi:MAG: hypothetical protein M1453_09705 [Acidobacteria bacterium]|nr:hypothetical protein [Acidobacteriota bacterium]MCL5288252.1 hypothetical protein [Acidobacteriota bacterium]